MRRTIKKAEVEKFQEVFEIANIAYGTENRIQNSLNGN